MNDQVRVTADVTFETKTTRRHYRFTSAKADEENDFLVISLTNTTGQKLIIELPRTEVKRLFNWKMILRL